MIGTTSLPLATLLPDAEDGECGERLRQTGGRGAVVEAHLSMAGDRLVLITMRRRPRRRCWRRRPRRRGRPGAALFRVLPIRGMDCADCA
jgi:hypothetical protein